jgi:HEAT repeat protein
MALAAAAIAESTTGDPVQELLTAGDYVPARTSLDQAAGTSAEGELLTLAGDQSGTVDTGIRLRAIRALADYPGTTTSDTLTAIITANQAATGIDTLYLRAAAISLATVDGAAAVPSLGPLLSHPSRDVRATTARAMAATKSSAAVPLLRDRLGEEPVLQVRLALSAAIRDLTDAPIPGQ